jgi:two-component system sensor histidine kinase UhpB
MNVAGRHYPEISGKSLFRGILDSCEALLTRPLFRRIGLGLLAGLLYYLGIRLGFALKPAGSPISMLWPPNAILLALLLLIDRREWWIAIGFVLPTHLAFQLNADVTILRSLGWFVGNVGEALLGALLVRRFVNPRKMFESTRGTFIFLCCAVVAAPLATSFVDAATVIFTGASQKFWTLWTARLFSNVLSELIIVPVIVTFWTHSATWIKRSTPVRYLEAFCLGTGLVIVSLLVFSFHGETPHGSPALIYLPLTFLLWAALRFGIGGLSVSVAVIALISIEGSIHGRGPFVIEGITLSVLPLQVLLCTVATPLILLTSVITERRRVEESLHEVAQKLITTQEGERERIARELHDDIGQQLALIESGLRDLGHDVNEARKGDLDALIEQAGNASVTARELSHGLHPSTLAHLGLEGALRRLCHDVSANKAIRVHLDVAVNPAIPAQLALCLYRISQEALQNVVRHSAASEVSIILIEDRRSIQLSIADNGTGLADGALKHPGLGLIGIRERLREHRGEMSLLSAPGSGTTLEVTLPIA